MKKRDDEELHRAVEAVADGEPVPSELDRTASKSLRSKLRLLRTVARIAHLHRTWPHAPEEAPTVIRGVGGEDEEDERLRQDDG